MRVRVERSVTDHGYGDGWVVLAPSGHIISGHATWQRAFDVAWWYAGLLLVGAA